MHARGVFVAAVLVSACVAPAGEAQPPSFCTPADKGTLLRGVPEASGVAVSRRMPGVLWTLNDSGEPHLLRFDAKGAGTAFTVSGAEVRDWEDLLIDKCPSGTCLYIADIGDNNGVRRHITIYRVAEPEAGVSRGAAEAFHLRYPDRAHDAEALVLVEGRPYIITKDRPGRVYRLREPLGSAETPVLEFVRTLDGEETRITGAAASPDGKWLALRSNELLLLYRTEEFVSGKVPVRIDLRGLNEPQGEGVAFGDGGEMFLVSEGGGDAAAGVLSRLNCAFPR